MPASGIASITSAAQENKIVLEVETEQGRQVRLLRTFSLIAFASHGTILLIVIIQALFANRTVFPPGNISEIISILGYLTAYKLSTVRQPRLGSWLVVVSVLISVGGNYW